ncbi:hypothetical protein PENNAL_c0020G01214 [Penicillium nalgiovense]|uniref:Uncharacterized protein n=1 Tax=Penicillium nalgiovense TaxID=60175 RepID=A0A1V6YI31_PENNA|nr:hypothetical protein PENNAL_c0020G01214 [Penicillium nalgiovense]
MCPAQSSEKCLGPVQVADPSAIAEAPFTITQIEGNPPTYASSSRKNARTVKDNNQVRYYCELSPPVIKRRAIFLGTLRITTVLLFGAACLIVAPACSVADDYPWYSTPAVIAAGALPMLFVSYTAAPYVNFIHLALPAFARKSREAAVQYAKDLPPTAVLYLTSMRFNTIPRQTAVRLGDLVPFKDALRPVTFQNLNPSPQRWWQGRAPTQFYTGTHSKPGRQTSAFFPELWNGIYQQIQKGKPQPR